MSRVNHLVGIGGAGMSAIAKILFERGEIVTGSDRAESIYSKGLEEMGIPVTYEHRAENVQGASIVIASSAIPADNVEIVEARAQGIPVVGRDTFLPQLTRNYRTIAVAGTHGKTTTTGMIATIMERDGLDPTYIVGGMLQDSRSNARAGEGEYFVIEADEYDRTFLGLRPDVSLITVVEHDHPDCYSTEDEVVDAFNQFVNQTVERVFVNNDDKNSRALRVPAGLRMTYGLGEGSDWQAVDLQMNSAGGSDFLVVRQEETLGLARIRLPGSHNVQNAIGALAVVDHLGVIFKEAREALSEFTGIRRRFEQLGEVRDVIVIDDYAHHPTEIRATLHAARERFPEAEIWAVFEPHTYSRVRTLIDDYANAFEDADRVIVTEVYAAREEPDPEFGGKEIAVRIEAADVEFISGYEEAAGYLYSHVGPGSVVICLSAGDANQIGRMLLKNLEEGEGSDG